MRYRVQLIKNQSEGYASAAWAPNKYPGFLNSSAMMGMAGNGAHTELLLINRH